MDEDAFVGREAELEQLRTYLAPRPKRQNVVALWGAGRHEQDSAEYPLHQTLWRHIQCCLWLSAQDESALKTGLLVSGTSAGESNVGEPP
jgi:hypothetical protein